MSKKSNSNKKPTKAEIEERAKKWVAEKKKKELKEIEERRSTFKAIKEARQKKDEPIKTKDSSKVVLKPNIQTENIPLYKKDNEKTLDELNKEESSYLLLKVIGFLILGGIFFLLSECEDRTNAKNRAACISQAVELGAMEKDCW